MRTSLLVLVAALLAGCPKPRPTPSERVQGLPSTFLVDALGRLEDHPAVVTLVDRLGGARLEPNEAGFSWIQTWDDLGIQLRYQRVAPDDMRRYLHSITVLRRYPGINPVTHLEGTPKAIAKRLRLKWNYIIESKHRQKGYVSVWRGDLWAKLYVFGHRSERRFVYLHGQHGLRAEGEFAAIVAARKEAKNKGKQARKDAERVAWVGGRRATCKSRCRRDGRETVTLEGFGRVSGKMERGRMRLDQSVSIRFDRGPIASWSGTVDQQLRPDGDGTATLRGSSIVATGRFGAGRPLDGATYVIRRKAVGDDAGATLDAPIVQRGGLDLEHGPHGHVTTQLRDDPDVVAAGTWIGGKPTGVHKYRICEGCSLRTTTYDAAGAIRGRELYGVGGALEKIHRDRMADVERRRRIAEVRRKAILRDLEQAFVAEGGTVLVNQPYTLRVGAGHLPGKVAVDFQAGHTYSMVVLRPLGASLGFEVVRYPSVNKAPCETHPQVPEVCFFTDDASADVSAYVRVTTTEQRLAGQTVHLVVFRMPKGWGL